MDKAKPINKVLIANRAEIALRIAQSCKDLGIVCASLHTTAERRLPHAYVPDESYCIGSGTLIETYLDEDKIISIAKKAGADAIHPGYGLLSEKASFAKKIGEAGLVFIGPSAEVVELMGSKRESKKYMESIEVPVIPGYHGENQSAEFLAEEAKRIGFPVLIKASAGGGGKGMRIVDREEDFLLALEGARRESAKAFGDGTVLLEKFITNPRHIEVQVFGDNEGNYLHFFERECSIQRRHQKIIEETPSPGLNASLRDAITQTAVHIARSVSYLGAGTVEFILDDQGSFYFLEMNTRLQVEHPITEMTTGCDLVALQIAVASGQALPLVQEDIATRGHAIEMRLYAEDPDGGFLPQTGTVSNIGFHTNKSLPRDVRFDCGYTEGNEVTVDFDPMMAKLTVWALDRKKCIRKALAMLEDVPLLGVQNNRDFLAGVLRHRKFQKGETPTHFVQTYKDDLLARPLGNRLKALLAACYVFLNKRAAHKGTHRSDPWNSLGNFRAF